jgi:hypothetical protein
LIRLRPTQWSNAVRDDAYLSGISVDPNRGRPDRHCACGTKLRRSKPLWDTLCDACDQKRRQELDIVAVVQEDLPLAERKHHATRTCGCGRPMFRQSLTCRVCYYERRRSA